MKLLKLSEDHYIIVDDSNIKEGDWVYQQNFEKTNNQMINIKTEFQSNVANDKNGSFTKRKITHSTQLLCIIHGDNNNSIGYLSISEVKELLGLVDVEKKAAELAYSRRIKYQDQFQDGVCDGLEEGFVIGYNQAMKDNKYTKEDMLRAYREGENVRYSRVGEAVLEKQFIQSLQPKTEWEVEIIDGKLKLK